MNIWSKYRTNQKDSKMPCKWLVKGTKEYCKHSTKNKYCGKHAYALRKGTTSPTPCKKCGNGTNSITELCIPCGQAKMGSSLWRERKQAIVN